MWHLKVRGCGGLSGLACALFLGLFTSGVCAQQTSDLDRIVTVDVAAQVVSTALIELSREAGVQVIMPGTALDRVKTAGVKGQMSLRRALATLLQGTAFTFRQTAPSTITVAAPASRAGGTDGPLQTNGEEKASSALQTIIVTAGKMRYGESVLETPVPMTVLSAQNLLASGQESLQDYYASVPGLNLTMGGNTAGLALVTIRGITTDLYTNPTVTASIDDVPLGSSTLLGGGELIPDLDPSDLASVEVLRGPQGTLYGANSMGGLLHYVTAEPSTGDFNAFVQGGLTSIHNGAELGYVDRAAANVPVSDTVALRVSGFDRRDPGYVDNIQSGRNGVNSATVEGGMLSALWRPSHALSWDLNVLLQTSHGNGSPQVEPSLGALRQSLLATTGSDTVKDQVYWATGTLNLGGVQLKSITSYGSYDYSDRLDYGLLGLDSLSQSEFGVSGTLAEDDIHTDRFTQELRMYVPVGANLDWLLGGFYDHERSYNETGAYSVNSTTLAVAGYWGLVNEPQLYEEYAGFTNLTYRFNPRFDIQLGARESQITQSEATISSDLWISLFAYPAYAAIPSTKESAFTYLATPRFKISPNLMAYARFASGFRPGALNGVSPYFPIQSKPDKTQNYELGFKGAFLDHRLTLDTSLYYISWKNVQIQVYSLEAFSYYEINESAAKSEGIELSADWMPLRGMKVSGWMSWDEAVLTQAFPPSSSAYGAPGDRLPFSARISGHLSFDQSFPIAGEVTGDAGIDGSYIGNRIGDFAATSDRQLLPGYAQMNLHASVNYLSWMGELYINNLMDKRGVLYGGIGSQYPAYFNYITPRTVGITVGKTFR